MSTPSQWKRSPGKPQNAWQSIASRDLKDVSILDAMVMVKDRELWKRVIKFAHAMSQENMLQEWMSVLHKICSLIGKNKDWRFRFFYILESVFDVFLELDEWRNAQLPLQIFCLFYLWSKNRPQRTHLIFKLTTRKRYWHGKWVRHMSCCYKGLTCS